VISIHPTPKIRPPRPCPDRSQRSFPGKALQIVGQSLGPAGSRRHEKPGQVWRAGRRKAVGGLCKGGTAPGFERLGTTEPPAWTKSGAPSSTSTFAGANQGPTRTQLFVYGYGVSAGPSRKGGPCGGMCGDALTRANVMKQAGPPEGVCSAKPPLLPGVQDQKPRPPLRPRSASFRLYCSVSGRKFRKWGRVGTSVSGPISTTKLMLSIGRHPVVVGTRNRKKNEPPANRFGRRAFLDGERPVKGISIKAVTPKALRSREAVNNDTGFIAPQYQPY